MAHNEVQEWLSNRSAATRRFIRFGMAGFIAAFFLVSVQTLVWAAAGWGSANFLPVWVLVVIYVIAAAIAVPCMYFVLARTAHFDGKIKWGSAAAMGVLALATVAMALAHSLPQLSTLVVSSPTEIRLEVYKSRFNPGRSSRKRYCRNSIDFGPIYAFRGGWCGVSLSKGETYRFEGHGNALAMRLNSASR